MSKIIDDKARVNMYIPHELKDWAWEQAKINGFNLSTMIQVMMMNYKKEHDALEMTALALRLQALDAEQKVKDIDEKEQ